MTPSGRARPADQLIHDLGRILDVVHSLDLNVERVLDADLDGSAVSPAMWRVLHGSARAGPLTAAELARTLSMRRQHVERLIRPLMELDLMMNVPPSGRTRRLLRAITDDGQRVVDDLLDRQRMLLTDHFDQLDPEEVAVAARVMRRLDGGFRTLRR